MMILYFIVEYKSNPIEINKSILVKKSHYNQEFNESITKDKPKVEVGSSPQLLYNSFSNMKKNNFLNVCSDVNDMPKNLQLSEKQNMAINFILETCDLAYQEQSVLSDEKKKIQQKELENQKSNALVYSSTKYSLKLLKKAKDDIKSSDEFSDLKYNALKYLLKNDSNLVSQITFKLGSKDKTLIYNYADTINDLYWCNYGNTSKCERNSIFMLTLCISFNEYCEMNFYDYLNIRYTSNQVYEFQNIVNILRNILSQ